MFESQVAKGPIYRHGIPIHIPLVIHASTGMPNRHGIPIKLSHVQFVSDGVSCQHFDQIHIRIVSEPA